MSNDLSKLAPKLLAQGLMALRGACQMPRLVNYDYSNMAAEKGQTIDVPIPSAITAVAVTPANTPPSTADVVPTQVQVPLDQWYEAPFYLSDKDVLESFNGTIPMQASEAVKALANNVNDYLFGLGKAFYGYTGTAGTTPMASDTTAIIAARKLLNKQLCPKQDRRFVLDPDAEANALGLAAFQYINQGGGSVMQQGELGQRLGFMFASDERVPTWTPGTITTGLAAKAATAQAIGLKAVVCTTAGATGACNLKEGDIVTFAGDTQTYVLTAAAVQATAATDVTLNIYPGLAKALAGGEAVAVKAAHVMNLAFHRDAITFATRPLVSVGQGLGNIITSATDPVSGLSLRLEISREHKRTRYSYDILYGGVATRREFGVRLAG